MHDPSIIRRLAFIKYLYSIGTEQSKSQDLYSAASILTFHDAVELFLQLSSEYLDAGESKEFLGYWAIISNKLPEGVELPQRESMRRLNKARIALKHHGNLPSSHDIDAFRYITENFFIESAKVVFSLSFDEISLVEFIRPDSARKKIYEAEVAAKENNNERALELISVAFEEVIDDYESRKKGWRVRSPFFFGRDLRFPGSLSMGLRGSETRKMAEFVDRVKESLESMQTAIKMLALGIDYRRYSKFSFHVPAARKMMSGQYSVQRVVHPNHPLPTYEDVRYCIDFVVETAIRLRDFDYDIPLSVRNG
ncbi:hypothetical protein [Methyloversatilis sp. NSM2]|uniref:hypothetical protein n=1 Tax=Methyloversatilis sp. NSM2 TaxID=3134135 RepID=UPI003118789D